MHYNALSSSLSLLSFSEESSNVDPGPLALAGGAVDVNSGILLVCDGGDVVSNGLLGPFPVAETFGWWASTVPRQSKQTSQNIWIILNGCEHQLFENDQSSSISAQSLKRS